MSLSEEDAMKTRVISAFVAIAAVSVLGLHAQSIQADEGGPTNLLANPGFEQDAVGLSGKLPTGWAKSYGDPVVLEIVEEPRPGSPGDKALKINSNETMRRGGVMSQLVPFDATVPLKVSVWMKDGGDMDFDRRPYIGVAWYDDQREPIILRPGTKSNYIYLNYQRMPDWQLVSYVLQPFRDDEKDATRRFYSIPNSAAFFEFRVFTDNYPWPAWVDDPRAVQVPPSAAP